MQLLLVSAENSNRLMTPLPPTAGVKVDLVPAKPILRCGAFTAAMVNAENLHQTFRGVKMELPGGYNIMDATSRLNVLANNALRVAQAWGWDVTIGEHRFFQPPQHKWETTSRDLGNNALSSSLISLVKGDFLSDLFIDGLVKSSRTSLPETYTKDDDPWQRTQKVWHNTVRHPFRQAFGLSAHPLCTIGHVLPKKERSWLDIKPLDTNILQLKRFGDTLSLKTTFEAVQQAILEAETTESLFDMVRKAGIRFELKQLYISLQPNKTIKPQVMDLLATLFDEKTGHLNNNAFEMAPSVEAMLQYYLELYQSCGGQGATEVGIKKILQQVLNASPMTVYGTDGLLKIVTPKQRAMAQAETWFTTLNKHWKREADQAVRLTTHTILEGVNKIYAEEQQKANFQLGNKVSRQVIAQRFAAEVAPKLLSKTGNNYSGELAAILEPALQLSKRTALLNEYETHRSTALLIQTVTQALFTCFVLGNLLLFIVNTLARLDVDFKGPHGETRLDFGEMKRSFKRWLKKQLGQAVEEPEKVRLNPKVSLDLSLGNNLTLRKEQQLLNTLSPILKKQTEAQQKQPFTTMVNTAFAPPIAPPTNPSYLEQSIAFYHPELLQKQPNQPPVALAGGML
jgi:hypothetical protein